MTHSSHVAAHGDAGQAARVKVVGVPHAYSVVATEPLAEGGLLFSVHGVMKDRASRHSIQIDEGTHVDVEPGVTPEEMQIRYPWRFLNHSCDPNAVLRGRDFVALRTIAAREGVTYNYNTTEFDMAAPFACRCGHDRCLGPISGFAHLPPAEQTRLRPWLADHLRRRLDSTLRSTPA